MVVSVENKIKAVEDYLSDRGESYTIVATRYGIGRYALRVLTGIYQVHGREKLLNPPHITGEFRVNLVEWKEKNHASLEATCIKFGFPKPTSVSNWEKIYQTAGTGRLLMMHNGGTSHATIRSRQDQSVGKRESIITDSTRCLKKTKSLQRASKRELSGIIIELRSKYKLADLIAALPISMSTFQYWQTKLTQGKDNDQELGVLIQRIFDEHHGNYGTRRVVALVRKYYQIRRQPAPNHKRIQRIMHKLGIKCEKYSKLQRRYDSSKGPKGRVAKNHLNRRNKADRSFQKMVCDVTELKAKNGDKVYLEVIKDLYSNRILEWEISRHPTLAFSLEPLRRLVDRLPETNYQLTLHTDQGWQYVHRQWRRVLRKGNIRQSMSRRATCLDNAACETVFNKLKAEIGPSKAFEDGTSLEQAVDEWIHYYNNDRIQGKLGYLSPRDFELAQAA